MAKVDPFDDSVKRYVISRHRYDSETRHFRWVYERAFDRKREYLEIGYFSNSAFRRARRIEQGAFRPVTWRSRISFFFHSNQFRFLGRRRSL
jgi:hypothetical protein